MAIFKFITNMFYNAFTTTSFIAFPMKRLLQDEARRLLVGSQSTPQYKRLTSVNTRMIEPRMNSPGAS